MVQKYHGKSFFTFWVGRTDEFMDIPPSHWTFCSQDVSHTCWMCWPRRSMSHRLQLSWTESTVVLSPESDQLKTCRLPIDMYKFWEFCKMLQLPPVADLWAKFQILTVLASLIPHFCVDKHAKFHVCWCNVSPREAKKNVFGPQSKWNAGMLPCWQACQ